MSNSLPTVQYEIEILSVKTISGCGGDGGGVGFWR